MEGKEESGGLEKKSQKPHVQQRHVGHPSLFPILRPGHPPSVMMAFFDPRLPLVFTFSFGDGFAFRSLAKAASNLSFSTFIFPRVIMTGAGGFEPPKRVVGTFAQIISQAQSTSLARTRMLELVSPMLSQANIGRLAPPRRTPLFSAKRIFSGVRLRF